MAHLTRLGICLLVVATLAACHESLAEKEPPPGADPDTPQCTFISKDYGPKGTVAVKAEVVVQGLEVPWGIGFLPNGDMLVTERPGRIRRVHEGKLVSKPVATVDIGDTTEGGLLGIAIDPRFATTRAFFVYVTVEKNGRTENEVQRWKLALDGGTASFEKVILSGIHAARFHDGGRLRFGPDGMLYVGTGDARNPSSAQDPKSLNGKLLRVTSDGKPAPGNPTPGSPVFVLGVRNTEGFDWLDDRTLALADHGPSGELGWSGHDEVDLAHKGDNLGWPRVHGCDQAPGTVPPVLSWEEAVPPGGLAIYRGSRIPQWKGNVIVGTLGSRHLERLVLDPKNPRHILKHEVYFEGDPPDGYGRLRDVVMGPDGELYITTSNCDGRGNCPDQKDEILRIVP